MRGINGIVLLLWLLSRFLRFSMKVEYHRQGCDLEFESILHDIVESLAEPGTIHVS